MRPLDRTPRSGFRRNVRGSMSGDVPDVRSSAWRTHGHHGNPDKEDSMALIQVKVIEGVFTAPQKQEIIERLTDAMVEIEGENMRRTFWCIVEEVAERRVGHRRPDRSPQTTSRRSRGLGPPRAIAREHAELAMTLRSRTCYRRSRLDP